MFSTELFPVRMCFPFTNAESKRTMLEISGYLSSVTDDNNSYQGIDNQIPFWFSEIIGDGRIVVEAAPGILSVVAKNKSSMTLESKPAHLLQMGRSSLYDLFYWGNRRSDFSGFCRASLEEHPEGIVLDVGGLSLKFSAETYVEECRTVVVIDRSLDVLKRSRDRVVKEVGRLPANFVFLQTDYKDLPFKPNMFSLIFALGALNNVAAVWELLTHCRQVLKRPGQLCMTSLVLAGRWPGDGKLLALHRKGKLSIEPRTPFDLSSRLTRSDVELDVSVNGNVAYITQTCLAEAKSN